MKYLLFIVVLALVATISSAQPKLRGNVEDRFLAEMEESDSTTGMENKEGDSVAMSEEEAYARHLEELDAYDRYLGEDIALYTSSSQKIQPSSDYQMGFAAGMSYAQAIERDIKPSNVQATAVAAVAASDRTRNDPMPEFVTQTMTTTVPYEGRPLSSSKVAAAAVAADTGTVAAIAPRGDKVMATTAATVETGGVMALGASSGSGGAGMRAPVSLVRPNSGVAQNQIDSNTFTQIAGDPVIPRGGKIGDYGEGLENVKFYQPRSNQ